MNGKKQLASILLAISLVGCSDFEIEQKVWITKQTNSIQGEGYAYGKVSAIDGDYVQVKISERRALKLASRSLSPEAYTSGSGGAPLLELLTGNELGESPKLVTPEFRLIQPVPEGLLQSRQSLNCTGVITHTGPDSQ